MIDVDATLPRADWTKETWDLSPTNPDELDTWLALKGITPEQFAELPAFQFALPTTPWLYDWAKRAGLTASVVFEEHKLLAAGTYDETKHPRWPKGHPKGGQFKTKAEIEAEQQDGTVPEGQVRFGARIDDQSLLTQEQLIEAGDAIPDEVRKEMLEDVRQARLSITDAINAIENVHDVPASMETVPLILMPIEDEPNTLGRQMSYQDDEGYGHSAMLQISPAVEHEAVLGTVVHEMGHTLDIELGRIRGYKSYLSESEAATGWRQAIRNTQTVRELEAHRQNFMVRELIAQDDVERADMHNIVQHFDYLLSDRELWARSYTDYIARRDASASRGWKIRRSSHDVAIENGLAARQWMSDEDFRPVAREFDLLLGDLRR